MKRSTTAISRTVRLSRRGLGPRPLIAWVLSVAAVSTAEALESRVAAPWVGGEARGGFFQESQAGREPLPATNVAQDGQDDEAAKLAAHCELLRASAGATETDYLSAVKALLKAGDTEYLTFLGEELLAAKVAGKQSAILREFATDADHCTFILPQALALLAGGDEELCAGSAEYFDFVGKSGAGRRALVDGIREVLADPSAAAAATIGAARASAVLKELSLVEALVVAMQASTTDPGRAMKIVEALKTITHEDFGLDSDSWLEWKRSVNGSTRQDLADRKIEELLTRNTEMQRVAVHLLQQILQTMPEQAVTYLDHDIEAFRRTAIERLTELAEAGEASVTAARAPVAARLEEFVTNGAASGLSSAEVSGLAALCAVVAEKEAARALLLKLFAASVQVDGLQLELAPSLVSVASGPADSEVASAVFGLFDRLVEPTSRVQIVEKVVPSLGGAASLAFLTARLDDDDEDVRAAAVTAVTTVAQRLQNPDRSLVLLQRLLQQMASDESERVRSAVSGKLRDVVTTLSGPAADTAFDEMVAALEAEWSAESRNDARYGDILRAMSRIPNFETRAFGQFVQALEELVGKPEAAGAARRLLLGIQDLVDAVPVIDYGADGTPTSQVDSLCEGLPVLASFLPRSGDGQAPEAYSELELVAIPAWNRFLDRGEAVGDPTQRDALLAEAVRCCETKLLYPWLAAALQKQIGYTTDGAVAAERSWERAEALLAVVSDSELQAEVRAKAAVAGWAAWSEFVPTEDGGDGRALPEGKQLSTVFERLILQFAEDAVGATAPEAVTAMATHGASWAEKILAEMEETDARYGEVLALAAFLHKRVGNTARAIEFYERLLGPGARGGDFTPNDSLPPEHWVLDLAELYLDADPAKKDLAEAALEKLPNILSDTSKERKQRLVSRLDGGEPQRGSRP